MSSLGSGVGGSRVGSDHAGTPWQELPEKWNNIKKTAVTVRQQVAPLQASEVTLLRQRCTAFEAEQQSFWERFRREAPFRYGPTSPAWPPVLETQQHLKSRVTSPWRLCIFLTEDQYSSSLPFMSAGLTWCSCSQSPVVACVG